MNRGVAMSLLIQYKIYITIIVYKMYINDMGSLLLKYHYYFSKWTRSGPHIENYDPYEGDRIQQP